MAPESRFPHWSWQKFTLPCGDDVYLSLCSRLFSLWGMYVHTYEVDAVEKERGEKGMLRIEDDVAARGEGPSRRITNFWREMK